MMFASVDLLQIGAIVLLVLACGALTAAVAASRRGRSSVSGGSVGAGELRTLMDQAEQIADGLANDLDARAARLEELIRQADARLARLERSESRPISNAMIEPHGARATDSTSSAVRDDPMTREICRLADTGLAPVEIARRLDQHTGKVELILALRQRRMPESERARG
ncbi:MAG: hypothetical protein IT438_01555 [Phycisphaerales bacterium]|nr:hypothetical protein [Phycisphaerales bacterium]